YEPSLAFAAYLASLGLDWKSDIAFPNGWIAEWQEISPTDFTKMVSRSAPVGPVLLNLRCPWSIESGSAAFDYMSLRQLDGLFTASGAGTTAKPLTNK